MALQIIFKSARFPYDHTFVSLFRFFVLLFIYSLSLFPLKKKSLDLLREAYEMPTYGKKRCRRAARRAAIERLTRKYFPNEMSTEKCLPFHQPHNLHSDGRQMVI